MSNDCFGAVYVEQHQVTGSLELKKTYDVVLTVLSWEQRATNALLSATKIDQTVTAIWFKSPNSDIEQKKTDQFALLSERFASLDELRLDFSTNIEANNKSLENYIVDKYSELKRPLKVLIDISCLPKNYLLFLLGLGFVNDYFACFDCLYSAGVYDLVADDRKDVMATKRVHRSLSSEGEWTARQVPFLGSKNVFPKSKDLIVTVGGELGLTVPFIEKSEPRNLSLIFIKESAPNDNREMLESERLAYNSLMSEPQVSRMDLDLNDALAVASCCEKIAEESSTETISIMALGSKSHALGAGLAALANDKIEVICRVPLSYKFANVAPTGELFFYQIEDRFEPLNYTD